MGLATPRSSSVWRLTLGLAALTAAMLLVTMILLYQMLLGAQQRQIDRQLNAEAFQLVELSEQLDEDNFAAQVAVLAQESSVLIAWQGPEGMVGSFSLLPNTVPLLPRTAPMPVLDPRRNTLVRFTAGYAETRYGKVMLAASTQQLNRLMEQFVRTAAVALGATLLLTLALGYLFARSQLKRLHRFNRLAEAVEQGQLDARLPNKRPGDEFDQLARHFNRVLDNLTASLDTVQGISDNIAHDLRTPMTRLRLGLERRLAADPSLGQELEQLDTILATFDAMLSLTRLEKGQRTLEHRPVPAVTLVADVVEMMQPAAELNGQSLVVAPPVSGELVGDRNLLFQALFNLVDNAIKYAGAGATIRISADAQGLTVADNGPGVSADEREKLTQRLYRGDSSRTQPGLGLGLAMVKAIGHAHGGTLRLEDAGPGLTITLRLPPTATP
ncbi:sensor histidine kinase [Ferrimonas balearica]|uniref:sensor histidine kinase n=1 Tax=Ferrimonas balearica TaxID=44012 RepID=UPI001C99E79F|nr:HAMP domain-containing sensor histidine kinase [Ferrimonas balearica]MBY5993371.1 HAMP domain-containing histidine kinase [Ferrimonas balearica]